MHPWQGGRGVKFGGNRRDASLTLERRGRGVGWVNRPRTERDVRRFSACIAWHAPLIFSKKRQTAAYEHIIHFVMEKRQSLTWIWQTDKTAQLGCNEHFTANQIITKKRFLNAHAASCRSACTSNTLRRCKTRSCSTCHSIIVSKWCLHSRALSNLSMF